MSNKKVAIPPPGYRKEGATILTLKWLRQNQTPVNIEPTRRSWFLHQAKKLGMKIATRKNGETVRVYFVK